MDKRKNKNTNNRKGKRNRVKKIKKSVKTQNYNNHNKDDKTIKENTFDPKKIQEVEKEVVGHVPEFEEETTGWWMEDDNFEDIYEDEYGGYDDYNVQVGRIKSKHRVNPSGKYTMKHIRINADHHKKVNLHR